LEARPELNHCGVWATGRTYQKRLTLDRKTNHRGISRRRCGTRQLAAVCEAWR
jgi:hypothetical protein